MDTAEKIRLDREREEREGGGGNNTFVSSLKHEVDMAVPDKSPKTYLGKTKFSNPGLLKLIQERLVQIEKIQYLNHAHPLFKEWHKGNGYFIREKLGTACFHRYELISFSVKAARNGFIQRPSYTWGDKVAYERGLHRAKVFFKSILWELRS